MSKGVRRLQRKKYVTAFEVSREEVYIRLVRFELGPGKKSVAESIADEVVPKIRKAGASPDIQLFEVYEPKKQP